VAATAAALCVTQTRAKAPAGSKEGLGWAMAHHSFKRTMTYNDGLPFWTMSSGTMALRDRLQLAPPVANRFGYLFSKKPVLTDDFEVSFYFRVAGPRRTTKDGAFAMWITPENSSAVWKEEEAVKAPTWEEGLKKQDMTLIGSKATFDGLGVMFSALDRNKRYNPSVTGAWGDGRRPKVLFQDMPLGSDTKRGDVQTHFADWRNIGKLETGEESWAQFKVRCRPGSVVGHLRAKPAAGFVEVFRMPATVKKGSYIGFSAQTGEAGSDPADEISILGVETKNFDSSVIGEEVLKSEMAGEEDWAKVLAADKQYLTQKSQKEAIAKLSEMLRKHNDRYNTIGHELKTSLAGLEERMSTLQANIGMIRNEIKMPYDGKNVDIDKVKTEIVGLRKFFQKDQADHEKKIVEVKDVTQKVKESHDTHTKSGIFDKKKMEKVSSQVAVLEENVANTSAMSNRMLLFLLFCVAGLGFLFLSRMRYYEKKHYI